jgi:hypothetical protein
MSENSPLVVPQLQNVCPMDSTWRSWSLGTIVKGRLDPGAATRVEEAASAFLSSLEGVLDLRWEAADDDVTRQPVDHATERGLTSGSPRHAHATFALEGHDVHIDRVSTQRSGPGFFYIEYRIHVDGLLTGRGGRLSCSLGVSGNDLPAVALVGETHAVVVGGDIERDPVAELHTTSKGGKWTEKEAVTFRSPYQRIGPRRPATGGGS